MNQDETQSDGPKPDGDDARFIKGQIKHQQISALVPESVSRGDFSTGAIVLVGNNEFIMDFVLRMAQPHRVAARVVLPHAVMPQLITALRNNLERYKERFGEPMEMPKGDPDARRPSIEEVYDDLKLDDEDLRGAYANAVMISHSPAEFCFDFITNFFPRSSVSRRVYVSASQVTRLLEAITHTYQEFQKRVIAQQQLRRQQQPQQQFPVAESPYYPPKDLSPDAPNEQIVGPPDLHMPPPEVPPETRPDAPDTPDTPPTDSPGTTDLSDGSDQPKSTD